jgi:hypothetical protein
MLALFPVALKQARKKTTTDRHDDTAAIRISCDGLPNHTKPND